MRARPSPRCRSRRCGSTARWSRGFRASECGASARSWRCRATRSPDALVRTSRAGSTRRWASCPSRCRRLARCRRDGCGLSFAELIAAPVDLRPRAIERLTGDLAARLAREGMGGRQLDLGFHRVDGRVEHIRIRHRPWPEPNPAHLARLMLGKLSTQLDPRPRHRRRDPRRLRRRPARPRADRKLATFAGKTPLQPSLPRA